MECTKFEHLLLDTAFCCMASDGRIVEEEVALGRELCKAIPAFRNMDFDGEINRFVSEINVQGKQYITNYLHVLEETDMSEQEELDLIDIAIQVIKADNIIEYSEVKFFKTIRYRLKVSDEVIISHFSDTVPEIDLFLGEDIRTDISLDIITKQYFDSIDLKDFTVPKQ
jgi:uncharacterized tellurite resistance protein B-like protein